MIRWIRDFFGKKPKEMTREEAQQYLARVQTERTIESLKAMKQIIDDWLQEMQQENHKGMKYVGHGIWINKKYKDLKECLDDTAMIDDNDMSKY